MRRGGSSVAPLLGGFLKTLDENRYTVVDLEDDFPVERFYQYFNEHKAL